MKRRSIFIAFFLGFICLICVLLIQYIWIKKTIAVQKTEVQLHQRKDSLDIARFAQKVHFSLSNVLNDISIATNDSSDRYGAIRQIQPNLVYVEYQGELEPFYLENALKREFYKIQITNDFQYSLYNCFKDSVIYSTLFKFSLDSLYENTDIMIEYPTFKVNSKSHYFSVYFPTFVTHKIKKTEDIGSPWVFLILVSILILFYLTYSVVIIAKQKKLSDIKTDFINNMTHELKTPIATIGLSSNTLMNDDFTNDPERLRKYASIIFRENKRLESQVERVLNIAKMNKNTTPLKKTYFDLHEFILEAKETFDFNLEDLGGNLTLHLDAQNHFIYADIVHVKNVIYNLLDNALKYKSEDRNLTLVINTRNDKKYLIIEISDNGVGISKDNRKYIFDKFYRVPTGNLHDVKGFGLGLYYVRTIIEEHHGIVKIKSEVNVGTTFSIYLPLKKDKDVN